MRFDMPRFVAAIVGASAAALLGLAALAVPAGAQTSGSFLPPPLTSPIGIPHRPFSGNPFAVCGVALPGQARCGIQVLPPADQPSPINPAVVSAPSGLSPRSIDTVYGFAGTGGSGTIALVDAYDDPNAASDLAAFSSQYGLPAPNFTKVNQTGQTSPLPAINTSWDLEISLDIEWAHAIAPSAPILLVEANSADLSDLLTAETYAGAHARYVSNSWGSSEFSGENADDSDFAASGVSYFAAAGDSGAGVEYPAASPNVTAVGGTSLSFTSSNALASETAWSGSGGGCSSYERATSAQSSFSQYSALGCGGNRAVPDAALDADPNSGVAVYDSTPYEGSTGWWTVGGTSLATPMFAAEASAQGLTVSSSTVYGSQIPFRDILTGSNGFSAGPGLDLVTGRGSWAYTPGTPTGLTATASSTGITLSWTAPSAGSAAVSTYNIWRGSSSGGETELAQGVTGTTFLDAAVTSGTKYFYEVQPVNSGGTGPYSNETSTTATATPSSSGGSGSGTSGSGGSGSGSGSGSSGSGTSGSGGSNGFGSGGSGSGTSGSGGSGSGSGG
jgi:subtilase family serine protease